MDLAKSESHLEALVLASLYPPCAASFANGEEKKQKPIRIVFNHGHLSNLTT